MLMVTRKILLNDSAGWCAKALQGLSDDGQSTLSVGDDNIKAAVGDGVTLAELRTSASDLAKPCR